MTAEVVTQLRIPSLPDDVLGAALAYAAAGWYVLPIDRTDKNAGSVLGNGWPAKSSRDPDVIASWFAGTDHGLALHMGRSGAVAFDVDHPDALPDELADLFRPAPFQSTRLTEPNRGHSVFACPTGRSFRNSGRKIGTAWGDIRGRNGIIVVEPTAHSKPGGRYLWTSSGVLPILPESLAERLVEHGGTDEDAATDVEVKLWMAAHPIGMRPGRLRPILDRYATESSGSRHGALTGCLVWLCKEVNAGYLAAPDALRQLNSAHTAALADPGHRNHADPKRKDFRGVLAWAVAQAANSPLVDGLNQSSTTIEAVSRAAQIAVAATEPAPEGDPAAQLTVTPTVAAFTVAVADEAQRIRVREAARLLVAAERCTDTEPPAPVSLAQLLAEPDESAAYRIDRLLPTGGRAVLAAQYKAGKSITINNLLRSLADGDAFLDEFTTEAIPAGRSVVLIDDELDRRQIRRWLADQGIVNTDRVRVIPLRGAVSSLDLLNPQVLARWAELLAGLSADFVILDCLRPVLDALGLDESRDAGRFLVAFDELLKTAKVSEAVLVHHMGHNGERSRGDSRIRDWPDAEWRLVRQSDPGEEPDPAAPRFFSAFGRDVDIAEGALTFDPATRHLSLTGGNRRDVKAAAALPEVLEVLQAATEALSGNRIEKALTGTAHPQKAIREAIKAGIKQGVILTEDGPRNATLHFLNPSSSSVRCSSLPVRQRGQSEFVSSSLYNELNSDVEVAGKSELVGNELDSTSDAEKPVRLVGLACGNHPCQPDPDCFACSMVVSA